MTADGSVFGGPTGLMNFKDDIIPAKVANSSGVKIDASISGSLDNTTAERNSRKLCANYWPTKAVKAVGNN